MLDWFAFALSTWFGSGLLPEVGTIVAVISAALVYKLTSAAPSIIWPFAIGTIVIGWWASQYSGQSTGITDDGRIVVDEVAGAGLLLALVKPRNYWQVAVLLTAYMAIDRLKPWPISAIESLPGAYGVMGDDLMVAVLGGVVLIPISLWQQRKKRSGMDI